MRRAGREQWSQEDKDAAAREFERLFPQSLLDALEAEAEAEADPSLDMSWGDGPIHGYDY
jgi:hypothetical protein